MTAVQDREIAWSDPAFERIVGLVGERTGLVFSRPRHATVEATIRRQAARGGRRSVADYEQALRADGAAADALAAELTIGETYFFRDSSQFDLLRGEILPQLAAKAGAPIRAWSAGCASGEEPYSLAILCHELGIAGRARIVGTDLSPERLEAAREARYGRWSLRGVPSAVIDAYFRRRDTRFDLIAPIRDLVEFRRMNLAHAGAAGEAGEAGDAAAAPWGGGMDLILCRNVLIYFDADTTARVMRHLFSALSPGGWLLLGASDPPMTDYAECEVVVTPAGLVYRRGGGSGSAPLPRPAPAFAPEKVESPVDEPSFMPRVQEPEPAPAAEAPPSREGVDPLRELLARVVEAHAAGRESLAAELAAEFIARGGDELTVWVIRVRALADAGALAEAGQACAAALDRHPLSAELTYLHAVLLAQAGRHAASAEAGRRAVYLDRTLVVAHLALGDALSRLGGDGASQAARAFRSAQRLLQPMPPDAMVPGAGGERAARLLAGVTARLKLTEARA